MTSWFRRAQAAAHPQPPAPAEPDDSPAALAQRLRELLTLIQQNSGRLPVDAIVAARHVVDTVREILTDVERDAAQRGGEPDVTVILSVRGIVDDYLPTTLRRYLALDPATVDDSRPTGGTPRQEFVDQIDALWLAAADVLTALRARDVDDLVSQGNFLRTKFSRSDLDL
jgi:hypothetical protein